MVPDDDDHQPAVLTTMELPDGSVSGGLLRRSDDELVVQLYGEEELSPGDEIRVQGDRYMTVTEVRHGYVDDMRVTDLVVEGPFLRLLRGHRLGDGWPQAYWRDLAAQCGEHGFARPIVRFLELLGELRTTEQIGLVRCEMRSLSAEHLATVTGQVGGALLNLERLGAPQELVAGVRSLYRTLLEEMSDRLDRGEFLHPPDPARHVRYGRDRNDDWPEVRDWVDLVS